MGFKVEVDNLMGGLAVRPNGRSKQTYDLTSSIVPRGTSLHRSVELEFPPIVIDPVVRLSHLSFPKIISGRIGGAVRPGSERRQRRQTVGLLDARVVGTENLSPDVVVMKSAKDRV